MDKNSVSLADLVHGRSHSERYSKQFASPDHTIVQQKRIGRIQKNLYPEEGVGATDAMRVHVQQLFLGTKKGALLEATPLILFC